MTLLFVRSDADGAKVGRVLKSALCVGEDEDDTGVFTMCVEIDDEQWAAGGTIFTLFELLDMLGGDVSQRRCDEMRARYPGKR